jgi:hypothetical protein
MFFFFFVVFAFFLSFFSLYISEQDKCGSVLSVEVWKYANILQR